MNNIKKSTRCRILKSIAVLKSPVKKPIMTKRHIKKYIKYPYSFIMYTDETRASLDGQDRWEHGWVLKREKRPVVTTRQKQKHYVVG